MTEYDSALTLPIAFPPPPHSGFLIDVLGKNGISTHRYTEGERRTHLGNLFEGTSDGRDPEIVSVNSPDAAQRLLRPEMCSFKIADRLFEAVDSDDAGVVIVNIPAAALVAETGDLETTIEAVQYVDTCLGGLIDRIREVNGTAIITASHGSSEEMTKRSAGGGNYRASRNPVPFHLIDGSRSRQELRSGGALEDVAPTILALLGIEKPAEMSGRDLRVH
jgi:2,3-bisphosphoglycerate-independent phosphoglycerate mutase